VDYERLLLENLGSIDQIIRSIARRHRLSKPEIDEFTSYVHLRLIDQDYRVLRKFQHRSQLTTYLVTVIGRMFADHRNAEWGRWRPSTEARRLGPLAVLLDRLVSRDGHSLDEALQILRITHRINESEEALRALWARLPDRGADVEVALGSVTEGETAAMATPQTDETDRTQRTTRVAAALNRGAAVLAPADRALVRLLALEGLSLVDLAGRLGLHVSSMRRRWNRIKRTFRKAFVAEGLDADEVERLMEGRLDLPATFLDEDPDAG
jgi:RNA polymerase sigma factor for flagellar operon FliA